MKKYILLILALVIIASCTTQKKSAYKSVNQRDVPEKYLKDFTRQRPDIKQVNWQMVDSNTYIANFVSHENECMMKFTRTATASYYVIPKQYIPSDITDYVAENYKGYKIEIAYITDTRNIKCYEVHITNKQQDLKLQFDLKGNFNKVID